MPVFPRPADHQSVSLADVAAHLGAASNRGEVVLTGVSLDSRSVQPGDLYAALPGFTTHGARFVADAVARGAVAVLTDEAGVAIAHPQVPVVVVSDPRAAVGPAAALVYGASGVRLLGVTGTNGKTTTAYLLDGALRALGSTTGLIGTVETRIGDEQLASERTTPEASDLHALLAVMGERGVDTCTMEVSSHAMALHRVDGAVFDVAGFTNLSQDHLDFHPTMEDYFAAKASLFTPEHARRGVVVVADAWGARLARDAQIPVTTLGPPGEPVDWQVDARPDGSFTLGHDGRTFTGRSPLPGDFNVLNTALAAVVLVETGVEAQAALDALTHDPHVPGRMERVEAPGGPLAVVDFAHTPDAVALALGALRPQVTGRLVAVLGAGGDRDPGKRPLMGAAGAAGADLLVVTDDNPRSEDPAAIRAAVLAGVAPEHAGRVVEVAGRAHAIERAVVGLGPGDCVVVLGKGHERGQTIAGVTHPFDDRTELARALGGTA